MLLSMLSKLICRFCKPSSLPSEWFRYWSVNVTPEEIAQVLLELWDRPGTLIVVSSDLSHYHDYETARRLDAATAAAIEHGDWASLGPHRACGSRALAGLLLEKWCRA